MGEPIAIKPSWTGSITFGLVAVPVKLYPATDTHTGPDLHMYHRADAGRVRNKRYCIAEDREVEYGDLAKGWEAGDGRMVVLTDADMGSCRSRARTSSMSMPSSPRTRSTR